MLWNVTGYDWEPIGVDGILANLDAGIARNRRRGSGWNLLLHDGGHRAMGTGRMDTVRAVDRLLTARLATSEQGTATRFVTVDAWAKPVAENGELYGGHDVHRGPSTPSLAMKPRETPLRMTD